MLSTGLKRKLATVKSLKADVSSVSLSSEGLAIVSGISKVAYARKTTRL